MLTLVSLFKWTVFKAGEQMAQIDLSLEINIVRHEGFSVNLRLRNPSVETLGGRGDSNFLFKMEGFSSQFLVSSSGLVNLNKKLLWSVSSLPWLDLSFQRALSLSAAVTFCVSPNPSSYRCSMPVFFCSLLFTIRTFSGIWLGPLSGEVFFHDRHEGGPGLAVLPGFFSCGLQKGV